MLTTLLRRAAAGDRSARRRIIESYAYLASQTSRLCRVDMGEILDNDDLEGAGYAGLVIAVDTFDAKRGCFKSHVIGSIRRAVMEHSRASRWRRRCEDLGHKTVPLDASVLRIRDRHDTEREALQAIRNAEIWEAVDALQPDQARILRLYYEDDLRDIDTAAVLGRCSRTARLLRHKAQQNLKPRFADQWA